MLKSLEKGPLVREKSVKSQGIFCVFSLWRIVASYPEMMKFYGNLDVKIVLVF